MNDLSSINYKLTDADRYKHRAEEWRRLAARVNPDAEKACRDIAAACDRLVKELETLQQERVGAKALV